MLYHITNKNFQNYEKCFLLLLKSSFHYRDIQIFPCFSLFKESDETGIIVTFWNCLFNHYQIIKIALEINQWKRNFSKHVLQSENRLVNSCRSLLFFMILSIKRDWVQKKKKKNKLTFWQFYNNPLSK